MPTMFRFATRKTAFPNRNATSRRFSSNKISFKDWKYEETAVLAASFGGLLGTFVGAYGGKSPYGRYLPDTIMCSILGGLFGAVAGAFYPVTIVVGTATAAAYCIDNFPLQIQVKKKEKLKPIASEDVDYF